MSKMRSLRWVFIGVGIILLPRLSSAAVLVLGNYTPQSITLTVADTSEQQRSITLAPFQLAPVAVAGAVDVSFTNRTGGVKHRLEPYNAYVFLVDEKQGVRLEGIALPGEPLGEDSRLSESAPPPTPPYEYPVTLYVDDSDPRTDRLWQAQLRQRFQEAADVIEKQSGIRVTLKGFGTWKASPEPFEPTGMLDDFERKVRVPDGELAIGYTSRKCEDKPEIPFGACRGVLSKHLLMRENRPRTEPEKVEALLHFLAQVVGAALSPDEGSVMRPRIANGLALSAKYTFRFDPLNCLAMSIWAEEFRKGPRLSLEDVSPANKIRLARVYRAMAEALPEDRLAIQYAEALDRAVAGARPRNPAPNAAQDAAEPRQPPLQNERDPSHDAIRQVLQAILARAELNAKSPVMAPDSAIRRLSGDQLTESYLRAAADAAWSLDEPYRISAFLIGLGVTLGHPQVLARDPAVSATIRRLESEGEKERRLALMGMPTINARRDFCRLFFTAAAWAEILGPSTAEQTGLTLLLSQADQPSGFSFSAYAAWCAGVEFAQQIKSRPELISQYRQGLQIKDLLPDLGGLREGLSLQRFERDYGSESDPRFQRLREMIRQRVMELPINR